MTEKQVIIIFIVWLLAVISFMTFAYSCVKVRGNDDE